MQLRIKDGRRRQIVATARRYRAPVTSRGRAADRQRPARPGAGRRQQTASTSVRTTRRSRRHARSSASGCWSDCRRTSQDQIDTAAELDVDYIGVGPVHATPTKPGRPAVGLELVGYAARSSRLPFFAIGGIDPSNVAAVHGAGARRIAVVRALTDAADPERQRHCCAPS